MRGGGGGGRGGGGGVSGVRVRVLRGGGGMGEGEGGNVPVSRCWGFGRGSEEGVGLLFGA